MFMSGLRVRFSQISRAEVISTCLIVSFEICSSSKCDLVCIYENLAARLCMNPMFRTMSNKIGFSVCFNKPLTTIAQARAFVIKLVIADMKIILGNPLSACFPSSIKQCKKDLFTSLMTTLVQPAYANDTNL